MRLYVRCQNCGNKVYLESPAQARSQLPPYFSLRCPHCGNESEYTPQDVTSEATPGASVGGAVAGGLVGLLGGPLGLILGVILGGGAGAAADNSDAQRARRFNEENL